MSVFSRRASLVCLLAVLAVACSQKTPATPEANASPTPTPAPATTPAPAPTPVNARIACGAGQGSGDGLESSCPRTDDSFLPDVDAAINRVVAKHPEMFDLGDDRGGGGYFVRNVDGYYRQVVQELGNAGRCAVVDGGGEIAVKAGNAFNDQYSIMISDGHIRRGAASYRATCVPAWF